VRAAEVNAEATEIVTQYVREQPAILDLDGFLLSVHRERDRRHG
jgi:hypothetical protein